MVALLSGTLQLLILGLLIQLTRPWGAWETLWLASMVAWSAGEAGTQRNDSRADPGDLRSWLGAWGLIAVIGLSLVSDSGAAGAAWIRATGGLALVLGAGLRVSAVHELGPEFRVRTQLRRELVASGVYAYLRHPAELGLVLCCVGTALCLASSWGALVAMTLFVPLSAWRVRAEEAQLAQRMPQAHHAYCEAVPAWLPSSWPKATKRPAA